MKIKFHMNIPSLKNRCQLRLSAPEAPNPLGTWHSTLKPAITSLANSSVNILHFTFYILHFTFFPTLLILISTFLFLSCEEEFDLNLPQTEPQLVVDGLISDEYTRHTVRLTLSDNYDLDQPHPKVSGAVVSISDGESVFPLTETAVGVYKTDSLSGISGRTYTLSVEWEGKTYTAQDQMPGISDLEPPYITVGSDRFEFEYRRHLFGFSGANRWELHVLPDVSRPNFDSTRFGQQVGITVFSDGRRVFEYFTHPNIEVNGLLDFNDSHFYGFQLGATVTVKKYALSDAYYQFLMGIFQETEWRGTLFDVIPANVSTNVSGDGLGFFAASAIKELSWRIE